MLYEEPCVEVPYTSLSPYIQAGLVVIVVLSGVGECVEYVLSWEVVVEAEEFELGVEAVDVLVVGLVG